MDGWMNGWLGIWMGGWMDGVLRPARLTVPLISLHSRFAAIRCACDPAAGTAGKVRPGCGSSSGASGGALSPPGQGVFGDTLVFLVARTWLEQELSDVFRAGPGGGVGGGGSLRGAIVSSVSEGGLTTTPGVRLRGVERREKVPPARTGGGGRGIILAPSGGDLNREEQTAR